MLPSGIANTVQHHPTDDQQPGGRGADDSPYHLDALDAAAARELAAALIEAAVEMEQLG